MSDQGFNFTPPPRRERKGFEPPPWEKDRFDELSKRREQQEDASSEAGEAGMQEAAIPTTADESPVSSNGASVDPHPGAQRVEESRVAAMLFELKAEDPPMNQSFHRVGLAAGLLLLVFGILLLIWAAVMIVVASGRLEQGKAGILVGLTVLMFGASFTGTGVWFVFRSLRQQGVL